MFQLSWCKGKAGSGISLRLVRGFAEDALGLQDPLRASSPDWVRVGLSEGR